MPLRTCEICGEEDSADWLAIKENGNKLWLCEDCFDELPEEDRNRTLDDVEGKALQQDPQQEEPPKEEEK